MRYKFQKDLGKYSIKAAEAELTRIRTALQPFQPVEQERFVTRCTHTTIFAIGDIAIYSHITGSEKNLEEKVVYQTSSFALVTTPKKTRLPTDLHLALEKLYE
ncbi:MAG: hypothetical protein Q7R96_01915 [Nanoarchaeota archaeon]|nr:hypothetical protein [Nanoarchaeota archaeon]